MTQHDSEVPANGRQVITACAFIHHNFAGTEKLFLPKRAGTKKFLPGVFELPGGHIDWGEDIMAGLRREIDEEFGMQINLGDAFAAFTYQNDIKGSHSVEVVYFATFVDPLQEITLDPTDHSTFDWFTHEDAVARRDEIVAPEYAHHEAGDDPEFLSILRGFDLLNNQSLNFG